MNLVEKLFVWKKGKTNLGLKALRIVFLESDYGPTESRLENGELNSNDNIISYSDNPLIYEIFINYNLLIVYFK